MRVTHQQANTLASERDSIQHHLGTLLSQESHSRTSPRPCRIRQQRSPTVEDLACEFCQSLSHITTKCPTTPHLVYDQAETPPRPLRPDESFALPASWLALHQATLHYLVLSVNRYFRILHDDRPQHSGLLRTIQNLLDLTPSEQPLPSPEPSLPSGFLSCDERDFHLFDHAVTELVALLHTSPILVSGVDDPVFVAICTKYYSPIFGHMLEDYKETFYS
jgi:hypothetical protein